MRAARLTFGDRVHCPFLRPFFLDRRRRRARVARVAETIAAVGERVVAAALADPALFDAVGLTDAERRARRDRPRLRACEHRVAARRVPAAGRPAVRRVQRRVAGRPRLHRDAGRAVRRAARDGAVPRAVRRAATSDSAMRSSRRCSPATASGAARRAPPTVAHRRLARRADVERVRDPRDASRRRGVPTDRRRSARARRSTDGALIAGGRADRSRLPPRAHQRHRRATRTTARRSCDAYAAPRRLRGEHVPLQDSAQEGVLRRADRRAHQRRLFTRDERALVRRARAVDAAGRATPARRSTGSAVDLLEHLRASPRRLRDQAERRVRRHGRRRSGGRSTTPSGTPRSSTPSPAARAPGSCRSASPCGARCSRRCETPHAVVMRDMLVDLAPVPVPRARGGVPDAPERTGLANVTSGGGQVPSFVGRRPRAGLSAVPFDCQHRVKFGRRRLPDRLPGHGAARRAAITRASSATATFRRPIRASSTSRCSTCTTAGPTSGTTRIVHAIQNAVCDLQRAPRSGRPARSGSSPTTSAAATRSRRPPAGGTRSTSAPAGPGTSTRAERRRRDRLAGHPRGPRVGSAAVPPLRRASARITTPSLLRRLSHLRRDVPLAGHRRRGAARPGEGRQERRHRRERADAGGRRRIPGSRRFARELPDRRPTSGSSTTASTTSSRWGRCRPASRPSRTRRSARRPAGRRADDDRGGAAIATA